MSAKRSPVMEESEDQVLYGDEGLNPEHHEVIENRGLLIDLETGEILGPADTTFHVDSQDAAEWVMAKMLDDEVDLFALEQKEQRIIANIRSQKTDTERHLASLHRRFDVELEEWARGVLGANGWRSKTLKTACGQISFRLVKGTHKILDQALAVAWAKHAAPEIVRVVESVNVSDVLTALDDGEAPGWLETTPAGERMYVRTNVGVGKE